jgi:hypothetical protein
VNSNVGTSRVGQYVRQSSTESIPHQAFKITEGWVVDDRSVTSSIRDRTADGRLSPQRRSSTRLDSLIARCALQAIDNKMLIVTRGSYRGPFTDDFRSWLGSREPSADRKSSLSENHGPAMDRPQLGRPNVTLVVLRYPGSRLLFVQQLSHDFACTDIGLMLS